MKKTLTLLFSIFMLSFVFAQKDSQRVISTIDSTQSPELVLIQEFTVKAPLDKVWSAYTTKEGWENWAVPLAEVDFKVGGTIKTNYNKDGAIGDNTTITTHIINYVPEKLITLQAEITDNFPDFMKKEAEDFYNVIYFNELEDGNTQVESFGIGYKNTPKYLELINYFIPANEQTLMSLMNYLENE
ncbi:SRPBCC family protein [Flagellimonas oceanensis]|uniref:SRPBCC family protein n=1 Tax=Flagellimonas oceanensis TaxID=2499163 RepID=UPI000F8F34FE|nr:SRPBCC domain-containing protein [Allomuricauda oceanensis]